MAESERFIKELMEEFENRGFMVNRRGFIEGISGIRHYFDIILEDPKSGRKIAFSLTDRIRYEHVLSILAMRIDSDTPHVIVANEVEPSIEELLRKYNVFTISFNRPKFSMLMSLPTKDIKQFTKMVTSEILRFLSTISGGSVT